MFDGRTESCAKMVCAWFVTQKDGQKLPSKKGISLSAGQFDKIKSELSNIDVAFNESNEDFSLEIGTRYEKGFVTLKAH